MAGTCLPFTREFNYPQDENICRRYGSRRLRVPEFEVWLELVKKVNPDVFKAAQILDSWLGPDGIAGGAISEKLLLVLKPSLS
tara:strand:- start:1445 stop:1693 length:249 start_codon:yes stop_codon:yes gene_type:complete